MKVKHHLWITNMTKNKDKKEIKLMAGMSKLVRPQNTRKG